MIRVGFLQNPIGFSVFQLFLREGILILKGNYLTCQVRHTIFKMDIYYIGNGLSFYKLHLTDVPKSGTVLYMSCTFCSFTKST